MLADEVVLGARERRGLGDILLVGIEAIVVDVGFLLGHGGDL